MEGSSIQDILLFLLLLVTLATGWWLGRRSIPFVRSVSGKLSRRAPSRDYFIGLNYLLNDEPDDAIDIFTDFLEMNSGSLETYLALGKLLRRRGKVDRSINIYQDLLGQSGFSPAEMNVIRINMVQSYIAAGLLDRAELILEDLRREKGDIKIRALILSASIFQQEKDWPKGVQAIAELLKVCPSDQRATFGHVASHFYCEMAEEELEREHMLQAREHLRQALAMDKGNTRVSILRGRLEAQSGNFKDAVKYYLKVEKQDPAFMVEVFDTIIDCFKRAGKDKALRKFIDKNLEKATNTSVLISLANYLQEERGQEAMEYSPRTEIRLTPRIHQLFLK